MAFVDIIYEHEGKRQLEVLIQPLRFAEAGAGDTTLLPFIACRVMLQTKSDGVALSHPVAE